MDTFASTNELAQPSTPLCQVLENGVEEKNKLLEAKGQPGKAAQNFVRRAGLLQDMIPHSVSLTASDASVLTQNLDDLSTWTVEHNSKAHRLEVEAIFLNIATLLRSKSAESSAAVETENVAQYIQTIEAMIEEENQKYGVMQNSHALLLCKQALALYRMNNPHAEDTVQQVTTQKLNGTRQNLVSFLRQGDRS